jgi:hypothetical protein
MKNSNKWQKREKIMSEPEKVTEPTTPPSELPEATEEKPIDPVLVEKLANLKIITKTHSLLGQGIFPGVMAGDLLLAQEFVSKLHAPLMKECETHPDWLRATDPAKYKAQQEMEKKSEETQKKAEEKRAKKMLKKKPKGH